MGFFSHIIHTITNPLHLIGSGVGTIVGTIVGGPVGGFIGSTIGGTAGTALANSSGGGGGGGNGGTVKHQPTITRVLLPDITTHQQAKAYEKANKATLRPHQHGGPTGKVQRGKDGKWYLETRLHTHI